MTDAKIQSLQVKDVRFPTSDRKDGSDAMHPDPDYSCAWVEITTDRPGLTGTGLTFTIGRGTELCVAAVEALRPLVVGRTLSSITSDFAGFWRALTSDSQLRWVGPEKGVLHLATAAIVNAVWDLIARAANQPLWRLIADMPAEQLVASIDFRYISDALTPEQALAILRENEPTKAARIAELEKDGFPAYTTSCGWLGYSDERIRALCREGVAAGFTHFKIKVGASLADDLRRAAVVRAEIGPNRRMMFDANQRWDVDEAISHMRELARFDPWWIEEPTSPDDVLGHARIARALHPIGVATGEQCQNRVLFKQFFQAQALRFCQLDSCRLGGLNEVLAVLLLAKKFGVPVCPHAGGVGLCEYVNHIVMIDYARIGASFVDRIAEYVDHLSEHFENPSVVKAGRYLPPATPGYGARLKAQSVRDHEFPDGPVWRQRRARADGENGAKP